MGELGGQIEDFTRSSGEFVGNSIEWFVNKTVDSNYMLPGVLATLPTAIAGIIDKGNILSKDKGTTNHINVWDFASLLALLSGNYLNNDLLTAVGSGVMGLRGLEDVFKGKWLMAIPKIIGGSMGLFNNLDGLTKPIGDLETFAEETF